MAGSRSAEEWLAHVDEAEASGDYLTAYDRARRGLEEHEGYPWLQHRAILSAARSGSRTRALELWDEWRMGQHQEKDIAALRARIEKEKARLRLP